MKKLALALSCCALGLSATAASAAGVYVGGNIGFAVPPTLTATSPNDWAAADLSFDSGLALAGAVGYDFDGFRVEGELGYQENNSDDTDWSVSGYGNTATFATTSLLNGNLTSTTLMANGYYDFKNDSPYTPYLGMGLGAANVEIKNITGPLGNDLNYSVDDSVFAYQFIAGCSYAVNKNFALDLSYRYVGADDPSFDDSYYNRVTDFEFASHNFMFGGRYTF